MTIYHTNITRPARFAVLFAALTVGLACQHTGTESSEAQTSEVKEVFERVVGPAADQLHFDLVKQAGETDWFRVSAKEDQLTIVGTSPSSLTYGAYSYLNDIGALSVSWEGKRVAFPDQFEVFQGDRVATPFDQRTYLNVVAYGYSMPWWGWERWQTEVDWMALHGVNNPVAMEGQEYVWQQLWKEFGVDDEALADYFSGPVFTPWQRMGNIEGHKGPLPQSWIEKKHLLQQKVMNRMQSLGMEPVVPAFGGYVPKQLAEQYPDAKIYKMEPWSGFDRETYWVDPADPLFAELASRFLQLYTEAYGTSRYYLSDSFNEMLPPVSEETRYEDLANYGKAIYDSIARSNPDAVWVLQGWMFGADDEFWDLRSIEAFLSQVPDDRVMIHDISNDRYAVWEDANAFYGKSWIYGFIHNYGASNPVYGDLRAYKEQVQSLLKHPGKGNLAGFGVFPEGIENNSVVYEFLYDLPWQSDVAIQDWLKRYSLARYGKASQLLMEAWELLTPAIYSTAYWDPRWWEGSAGAYVLFKRPESRLAEFDGHPTDSAGLRSALDILLDIAPEYSDSPLFMHDLIDWYRHYMTLEIDGLLQDTLVAYQNGNIAKGDQTFIRVTRLVEDLDLLLGMQQDTLSSWINDARAYAESAWEADYYEKNAKQQITLWGGVKLKDYASKAWQGMYKDFYLPRWTYYFQALKASVSRSRTLDEGQVREVLIEWEKQWVSSQQSYTRQVPENPLELMESMLDVLGALQ